MGEAFAAFAELALEVDAAADLEAPEDIVIEGPAV